MVNYNETIIEGTTTTFTRASSGYFYNKDIPEITFNEDNVTVLANGEKFTKEGVSKVTETLENPLEEFELLNPEDDSVVGTMKYQEVFLALYSLYRHSVKKRDTVPVEEPVDEPVDDGMII